MGTNRDWGLQGMGTNRDWGLQVVGTNRDWGLQVVGTNRDWGLQGVGTNRDWGLVSTSTLHPRPPNEVKQKKVLFQQNVHLKPHTHMHTVEPLNNGHVWDQAFCPL